MIFLTVGAQMPFDRLVRAVDAWAGRTPGSDVFAQVGPTDYRPRHLRFTRFMPPADFNRAFAAADLVVAHAGMGTIITALELARPLLVMPRRGDLAETRNDHQLATARRFGDLGLVFVAHDEVELAAALDDRRQRVVRTASADLSACACARRAGDCPFAAQPVCLGRRPGAACDHLLLSLRSFIGRAPPPLVASPLVPAASVRPVGVDV